MRTNARHFEFAFASGLNTVRFHKLAHPLLACPDTLLNQFPPDTRPAVGPFHLFEDGCQASVPMERIRHFS